LELLPLLWLATEELSSSDNSSVLLVIPKGTHVCSHFFSTLYYIMFKAEGKQSSKTTEADNYVVVNDDILHISKTIAS